MRNPYRFDERGDGWLVLNVSGGRTSAYLLRKILDAHDGLPDNCVPIFCNTGKEREETLDFLHEIEYRWDIPLVWLEYIVQTDRKPKHHYRIVDYSTASRDGEPFDAMIETRKMLPHVVSRFCTAELKVMTIERYMRRQLGVKPKQYRNVLGMRYDEPRRWMKNIQSEDCRSEYPLVYDKVTVREVNEYWAQSDFDLQISSLEGNCDLCFLKGKENLIQLIRKRPESADWWMEKEKWRKQYGAKMRDKTMAGFRMEWVYEDLVRWAQQDDLQMVLGEDQDEPIPCFCGD